FSSRRRHTRSKRDWSSDVCSSDLFFNFLFVYRKLFATFHLDTSSLKKELRQSKRRATQSGNRCYERNNYFSIMVLLAFLSIFNAPQAILVVFLSVLNISDSFIVSTHRRVQRFHFAFDVLQRLPQRLLTLHKCVEE